MQAIIYRAHQLKAITDNQYQYMMRQVSKKGWRTNEPGDTPYYFNENIFQGAIDVLFEADYLNPNTFLQLFKKYGVTMYPEDIGELLHLRKDTLRVEPSQTRIVQLKSPDQQDRGNYNNIRKCCYILGNMVLFLSREGTRMRSDFPENRF